MLCLSHILQRFDGNLEEKMARKQYSMVERAFQELAIDITSDMEPEDEDFGVVVFCFFCQMVMILSLKVAMKPR